MSETSSTWDKVSGSIEFEFDGEELFNSLVDFLGECSNSDLVGVYNDLFANTQARFKNTTDEIIEIYNI